MSWELQPTGRSSEVVEVGQPTRCANGHELAPPLVGFAPCSCVWPGRGHRTYRCRECGDTVYVPAHVEAVPSGDKTEPTAAPGGTRTHA